MDNEWVGKSVSLDCGGLGFFQGLINSIQLEEQTISLANAFQNGRACTIPKITLRAEDIKNIDIIDHGKSKGTSGGDTSAVSTSKQKEESSTIRLLKKTKNKPNPTTFNLYSNMRNSPHRKGRSSATPSRKERDRQRDEECFETYEEDFSKEFDFEKNLALFDKKLVFEEIEDANCNQPDVVRLVDCNKRKPEQQQQQEQANQDQLQKLQQQKQQQQAANNNKDPKYRNDENVLPTMAVDYRPISVKETAKVLGEYQTEMGVVVPAITNDLREELFQTMFSVGVEVSEVNGLVARASSELAMQLIGGERRIDPKNKHQAPLIVFLCGIGKPAIYGLITARFLAAQGVKTIIYRPEMSRLPSDFEREFKLYKKTGQKWTTKVQCLPTTNTDMIVSCLDDHMMWIQERRQPWHKDGVKWAKTLHAKVPILAIDPPNQPEEPALPIKVCVSPGLPLWYNKKESYGKLYMVNLSWPQKLYENVGITFESPYGVKISLPLYPR